MQRGVGPGPIAPDGSAVDLYLLLPYGGEVEIIETALPPGAAILEMGCGVGRVTRQLLAKGYRVVAVDNSPDMLRHVPPEVRTICSDIASVREGHTFDVVLFGSNLINESDAAIRAQQLKACRRHLQPGGRLVFERYDPAWLSSARVGHLGKGQISQIDLWLDELHSDGAFVEMCLRYAAGPKQWRQYSRAAILDDEAIASDLAQAGFGAVRWITRSWGVADAV